MSHATRFSIWYPSDGAGSVMSLLRPAGAGASTKSFGNRSLVWINGVNGDFVPYDVEDAAPTDIPSLEFRFFPKGPLNYLERMANTQEKFHMQRRFAPCVSIDNPLAWRTNGRIWHYSQGKVTSQGNAEAPTLRASGAMTENTVMVQFKEIIDYIPLSLSGQTTTEATGLTCITGIGDRGDTCGSGYPGPNKVMFAGALSGGGAEADIVFTVNGGGTWTALTNQPFAADEAISAIMAKPYGSGVRIIAVRGTTDAGNPPEIAYATAAAWDATTIAAVTWTAVELGTTDAEFGTAGMWEDFNRVYVGLDTGDIYLSTNQGESFTMIHEGAQDVRDFCTDPEGGVWAVGDTNTIFYERPNKQGEFTAKAAPAGGGNFTKILVCNDMTIYAGNGTTLFKNNNKAATAGGWSSVKAFGATRPVVGLYCEGGFRVPKGDPELLRVVIDDTTSGTTDGEVWESVSGGSDLQPVTAHANYGYKAVYWFSSGNEAVIVGDVDAGGVAAIHKLSQ